MKLAKLEDSQITFAPGTLAYANALAIPEGLTQNEWREGILKPLAKFTRLENESTFWWWGDACTYGEKNYGRKYGDLTRITGYSYATLASAAFVSKRIPKDMRSSNLSWRHHLEIASGFEDEPTIKQWLARSEKESWSTSDLRRHIRLSKAEYRQYEILVAAKKLSDYFRREDVKSWPADRCRMWINDLDPIVSAYSIMVSIADKPAGSMRFHSVSQMEAQGISFLVPLREGGPSETEKS